MEGARRILAVKLADFGDALLTTPGLRSLRVGHPDARLDVLTTPQSAVVYRHSGLVDDVVTLEKESFDRFLGGLGQIGGALRLAADLRRERYDIVVVFHHLTRAYGSLKHAALVVGTGAPVRAGLVRAGSRRGWFVTHAATDEGFGAKHEVEVMLDVAMAAGGAAVESTLAFVTGAEAEDAAACLLDRGDTFLSASSVHLEHEASPEGRPGTSNPVRVAIHPGSGGFSLARRWSPRRFAEAADRLTADGVRVFVVGTSADDTAAMVTACSRPVVDLTDETDLPTLAAVLARMDAFLGGDSGVMHLATAMGVPVVGVFGPSNELAWGPWSGYRDDGRQSGDVSRRCMTVSLAVPCRPCLYRGYSLGARHGCASRDCLTWLPADAAADAVGDVLGLPRDR